jgi:glyoxylase-like metal-dependent hydrolase (beta-lactamase superfamily II)
MTYIIHSVEGNAQRLDGGAMFGNVPRALWERWIEPDERHRIPLACRAFLIHDTTRDLRILLEAGIGVFFEPKLADRFGVDNPGHQLLMNLAALGVDPAEIDVVVLSHLHFDHAGGLLTPWRPDGSYKLVFPRARFLVGSQAWERANAPHFRDRASFVPELHRLITQTGRLELVDSEASDTLGPDFSFTLSDGHTPGLLLTRLGGERGGVVFCGDLIPGAPWVHLPVTMGYDRYPELLIQEKQAFLERVMERGDRLLFTHDAEAAACGVARDERGRFSAVDKQAALKGEAL